eukprot:6489331-Amphidinium_carterae.1
MFVASDKAGGMATVVKATKLFEDITANLQKTRPRTIEDSISTAAESHQIGSKAGACLLEIFGTVTRAPETK